MRPWSDRPIKDCLEPLQPLPAMLLRLEPHPYASLGAPYATGTDPFRLRSGVIARLLRAENELKRRKKKPDTYRMSCQAFVNGDVAIEVTPS